MHSVTGGREGLNLLYLDGAAEWHEDADGVIALNGPRVWGAPWFSYAIWESFQRP
jgi:hypothetical protein